MNDHPLEVYAERRFVTQGIELTIIRRLGHERIAAAQDIQFEEKPAEARIEPAIFLLYQEAQQLMDELWKCGLRPTEGTGSAGSLAATERHLKDMQKITKGLLQQTGVKFE